MSNILDKFKNQINNYFSSLNFVYIQDEEVHEKVDKFLEKVDIKFDGTLDQTFSGNMFIFNGIRFLQPFHDLQIFSLDDIWDETESYHDFIKEYIPEEDFDFLVLAEIGGDPIIYRIDLGFYLVKYRQDIIRGIDDEFELVLDNGERVGTYEEMLEYIYDFYIIDD